MTTSDRLPVLPLGQLVVYPHVVLPLSLEDAKAVQLIDEVVQGNKRLLLGVVKPVGGAEPVEGTVMQARADELYEVGTLGVLVRMLKLGDGSARVMVQGLERARMLEIEPAEHWLVARYETMPEAMVEDARTEALKRTVHAQFSRVIDIAPYLGEELHEVLGGIKDAGKLADFIAANLDLALPAKAELLALSDVNVRLERLAELLGQELQVLEVGTQIQEKVKSRLDANQREYVLREQLRVIRQELGEDKEEDELDELGRRLDDAGLSVEARKVADRELRRLRQMSPQSAEYHVARTYLDVMASLPWNRVSQDRLDLKVGREILDRDHYDLKTVKERILEYLAVRTLNPQAKGSILCFVGPPGVGKTSLGQSIAEALGRRFTRVSLGGVRDEAEIRGHRRTYVGALPGRIVHALQRCETRNPLLMLDEVDKMGADVRGDPTAALLEVLDPAQNGAFVDHYIDVPFDLSGVMFIATANSLAPIPDPLLDRMEVLTLPGYTPGEKLAIAKRYLLPRQLAETGLVPQRASVADGALERLIAEYTREAGVRQLEREILRQEPGEVRQLAEGAERGGGAEPGGRRGDRAGVDAGGRRHHVRRSDPDARQGTDHPHGPARRRDEGVGAGRVEPAARPGGDARDPARGLHADRRAPPRAGGRGAERRTLGRHHDRHRPRLAVVPPPGAPRRGDDRRADAAGPRAPDRRAQGEADGGSAGRREDRARARAQSERPRGGSGRSDEAFGDQGRGHTRSGARAGAARAAPVAARGGARERRRAAARGQPVSDFATLDAAFAQIRERDGRYHERGYLFVLAALEFAQHRLPARRHLSGRELAWACRDFALEQFGLLAPTVLDHWGITRTEDLGRIVFMLIDVGLLARQESDRIEDFDAVYDFAEVFRAGYRWPGVA